MWLKAIWLKKWFRFQDLIKSLQKSERRLTNCQKRRYIERGSWKSEKGCTSESFWVHFPPQSCNVQVHMTGIHGNYILTWHYLSFDVICDNVSSILVTWWLIFKQIKLNVRTIHKLSVWKSKGLFFNVINI